MAGDIRILLDLYKSQIAEDLRRLQLFDNDQKKEAELCDSDEHQPNLQQSTENKENQLGNQKPSFVSLRVTSNEDPLTKTEAPDANTKGRSMLRYGEFSPNHPELLRTSAAPYLGLGEYDRRRNILQEKRRADYLDHLSKVHYNTRTPTHFVDYDSHDALLKPQMDKPKSILSNRRTGSPRERLLSDSSNSYGPSFLDGFSYTDRSEELEREKLKRENYQRELRLQIEEKRRLQALRDDQERRELELENRRFQHQLLRMQEEQAVDDRSHRDEQVRRHSDDLLRRKYEMHGLACSAANFRNTTVASKTPAHYSPPVSRRNFYSPSGSSFADAARFDSYHRKNALNRMDSLTVYDNTPRRFNAFSRYDSLGRIDALNRQDRLESLNNRDSLSNVQRRHSATQQDLSMRHSPKLQRRNSASRFDDALPVPVLKAHSPVAKELKNSVPFKSRQVEDRWRMRDVMGRYEVDDSLRNHDSSPRGILSHLGTIRMQLQQEQLRMDESLRQRDIIQSKAVDFH